MLPLDQPSFNRKRLKEEKLIDSKVLGQLIRVQVDAGCSLASSHPPLGRQRNPKAKAMRLMLLVSLMCQRGSLICARARKRKPFEKNGSYRPDVEYTAFPGEDLAIQTICSAQGVPVAQLTLRRPQAVSAG